MVVDVVEAVVVKVTLDAPPGTVTEAGTLRAVELETTVTMNGVTAFLVSATVQVPVPPGFKVVGVHAREFKTGGVSTVMVALVEMPFAVAVS
jgi:hypothetical protein